MSLNQSNALEIADHRFNSRLFSGTGKFSSPKTMLGALEASGTELVTLALKRVDFSTINSLENNDRDLYANLKKMGIKLLPNTSGAKTAQEAIMAAQLSKEAFQTNWLKLEIHPDPRYLMPDPIETLKAAEQLVKQGFVVMPYCHADPVLAKRLEEVGCAAVMPLGSPIGSNAGLASETFLKIIIEQAQVPVVIDAGIGAPSDAALAMELGADAVLVNTAIAAASDPVLMARAFKQSVQAGFMARQAGLAAKNQSGSSVIASPSSPLTAFLDQSA